jgi:NitT/TauT family transport system substrate-binding protein
MRVFRVWLLATLLAAFAVCSTAVAQPKDKVAIATGVDPSLATFYVAKTGGFFDKNGLDVTLSTGSSGSAMVPLLVRNQVQAVQAAEQAGLLTYVLDNNVVVAAQQMISGRLFGLVGRNVAKLEDLKGKKIGVAMGSASEVFWRALLTKLGLDAKDYTVIQIEPPEMFAAIERGNVDAVAAFEPWVTRILQGVPGTKMLRDNDGILESHNYIYINREWAEKNPDVAVRFFRALVEADNFIRSDREKAVQLVSTLLKLDPALTRELMNKVTFDVRLDQASVDYLKTVEAQLRQSGRLQKPIDWDRFIYPDIARKVIPDKVTVGGK